MREGLKPLVFVLQTTAGIFVTRSEGGWNTIFGLSLPQPHSSICLIPLWLSPVNRPAMSHEKKKAGGGFGPKGNLSVIPAALSRSRGALSPAGP